MKNLLLLIVFTIFSNSLFGQIINFEDVNFKNKLLEASTSNNIAIDLFGNAINIDINNNNEIEVNEVVNIGELNLNDANITFLNEIILFSNLWTSSL